MFVKSIETITADRSLLYRTQHAVPPCVFRPRTRVRRPTRVPLVDFRLLSLSNVHYTTTRCISYSPHATIAHVPYVLNRKSGYYRLCGTGRERCAKRDCDNCSNIRSVADAGRQWCWGYDSR